MSADVIPSVMPAMEAVAPTLVGALPLDSIPTVNDDNSDSELSELEMDGTNVRRAPSTPKPEEAKAEAPTEAPEEPKDDTPVEPHHWDDGVPVFKPTMKEFEPFEEFMNKVNQYGMQTGIIKVIPPKEWLDEQPVLDGIVKGIRAPNPIIQEIMADGNRDGYRILNLQHPKTYNLPGWGKLCQRPEHQPPARRGERRAQVEKPKRGGRVKKEDAKEEIETEDNSATAKNSSRSAKRQKVDKDGKSVGEEDKDRLRTPTSPSTKPADAKDPVKAEPVEPKMPKASRGTGRMGRGGSTSTSVSSRRKNASRGEAGKINEADFVDFEYKLDISDYTPERCAELERAYWKTLTYAPPLYGADMLGSLFDEKTKAWNLGSLPNLLDVMGTKIPGVNTAYLYLGMWKATFAWHLEDVDLYSINYLHFGAPKQWYSISQKDARKFEAAMASIWPQDAKACDQFLRHKTFLISPTTLLNKYGVKVNRTTHYPGEFVVTYPYGYHSGFNMGYNCAEAVNFALPSWLEMGRIAKKCDCEQAQDSVWIDVAEIERKMRGEETELEDSDEEEEEEEDEDGPTDLPTPPESSGDNKLKKPARKRIRNRVPAAKRGTEADKKLRVRLKTHVEPCCLCPNDIKGQHLLPTDDGRKAHRICAEYTPETEIENGIVYGVSAINKDRLDLKCIFCRSRKGAKIQCSQKKCVRSYHATCAAAAGMFVEQADVPVFGEDGTEYKTPGCEFSCRFHRAKRDKKLNSKSLEKDDTIQAAAAALKLHEICQFQLPQKDIFAGLVLENRKSEGTLLIEVLPSGEKFEIEYKYLLLAHASDYHLEKPSVNALPLPKSRQAKDALNTTNRKADDLPRKDDILVEGLTWAEFVNFDVPKNLEQVDIDFSKSKQILYYLGDISKESSACYTADHTKPVHDHTVSFLNTIPKAVAPARPSYATAFPKAAIQSHTPIPPPQKKTPILPPGYNQSGARAAQTPASGQKAAKPYEYKPRTDTYKGVQLNGPRSAHITPQQRNPYPYAFGSDPKWLAPSSNGQPRNSYGVQSQQMVTASLPYPTTYYANGQTDRAAYQNISHQRQPSGHSAGQSSRNNGSHGGHHHSQSQSTVSHQSTTEKAQQKKPAFRPSAPHADFNAIFMKYPYLRKEHNRPPTSYKSPYRQDGLGFCNGYEGDFKAHMAAQMAKDPNFLLKTPLTSMNRMNSHSSSQPSPAYEAPSKTYAPILPPPRKSYGVGQSNSSTPATLKQSPLGPSSQQNFTKPPVVWEKKEAGLHPAIRQNYGNAMFHQNYRPSSSSSSPSVQQQQQQQQLSQNSQGMNYSPSMRPEGNGLHVHRSSMGAQNQYMSSQHMNTYSNISHTMNEHNTEWNRQYQQSPMTPQPSPAAHYYSNHNSRPSSSHRAPQPSPYLPTPTALATPTPAPPLGEEQRRFLQDCTPPARSFYSDGYHRSAGAPLSKIIDDVPPPQQQQQQQQQKPQQAMPPLQWQPTQGVAQMSRPVSREQPKQQQQQYQPPMQQQQQQQQQQVVVDVPELGPDSQDMMQTLFANLRSLAERRQM